MHYSAKFITVTAICLTLATPAFAKMMPNGACNTNENAQVSISFNGMDKDVTAVKNKLDGKIAEIKALAAEEHFDKFIVQSNNYSINANYNNGYGGGEQQFQYNGSASFQILPADKAVDFMTLLIKKGYQASVSVNSYNNGNCPQN